jgi:hypothetical protein
VRHGRLSVTLFLLGRHADINTRSRSRQLSLLHAAAMTSAPAGPCICKLLLKYGLRASDMDAKGARGRPDAARGGG